MYECITIERRYGSGGNQIARELAKKLGYGLYDRNVLEETCKRLELPYAAISGLDEQAPPKTIFKVSGDDYKFMEERIFQTESEIIRDAAKEGGCVFVGRCASEILKDKRCLRVFITASQSFRLDRITSVERIPADQAESTMRKMDAKREKFFSAYCDAKWGSSGYFDMILNSGKLGRETCVEVLAAACRG